MIERYSRPEMAAIWTEQNKFEAYLKVEILACEAWAIQDIFQWKMLKSYGKMLHLI